MTEQPIKPKPRRRWQFSLWTLFVLVTIACVVFSWLGSLSLTAIEEEKKAQAIQKIGREGLKYVNIRWDVQDAYNNGIQKRMKRMVWSSGCNSWYLSTDGSNHALYPGFAAEYVVRARSFDPADYEIVPFEMRRT